MYKRLKIDNFYTLASIMHKNADGNKSIYALCNYEDAVELMRTLLLYRDVTVGSIKIAQFEYNGYGKEYFVELNGNTLDVEPAWHEKNEYRDAGYLWYEPDLILVCGDVHSSLLKDQDPSICYEIVWMDEEWHNGDYNEHAVDYEETPVYINEQDFKRILFHFFCGL